MLFFFFLLLIFLQGSFFGIGQSHKELSLEEKSIRTKNYIESLVTLADISGGMAMLFMRSQQRMKGAYRLRKAWKYYEEAFQLLHKQDKDNDWYQLLIQAAPSKPEDESSDSIWNHLLKPIEIPEGLNGFELRARNVVGRLIFGQGMFWLVTTFIFYLIIKLFI